LLYEEVPAQAYWDFGWSTPHRICTPVDRFRISQRMQKQSKQLNCG